MYSWSAIAPNDILLPCNTQPNLVLVTRVHLIGTHLCSYRYRKQLVDQRSHSCVEHLNRWVVVVIRIVVHQMRPVKNLYERVGSSDRRTSSVRIWSCVSLERFKDLFRGNEAKGMLQARWQILPQRRIVSIEIRLAGKQTYVLCDSLSYCCRVLAFQSWFVNEPATPKPLRDPDIVWIRIESRQFVETSVVNSWERLFESLPDITVWETRSIHNESTVLLPEESCDLSKTNYSGGIAEERAHVLSLLHDDTYVSRLFAVCNSIHLSWNRAYQTRVWCWGRGFVEIVRL